MLLPPKKANQGCLVRPDSLASWGRCNAVSLRLSPQHLPHSRRIAFVHPLAYADRSMRLQWPAVHLDANRADSEVFGAALQVLFVQLRFCLQSWPALALQAPLDIVSPKR